MRDPTKKKFRYRGQEINQRGKHQPIVLSYQRRAERFQEMIALVDGQLTVVHIKDSLLYILQYKGQSNYRLDLSKETKIRRET